MEGVTPVSSLNRAATKLPSVCYVATPYTKHAGAAGLDFAAKAAACAVADLALRAVTGVSPIVLAHQACGTLPGRALDPLDQSFWAHWCAPLLTAMPAVFIPDIIGWRESDGIAHEVREARRLGKLVVAHVPDRFGS